MRLLGPQSRSAKYLPTLLGRYKKCRQIRTEGLVGKRTQQEIGFSSIRGGDIVGDHTVFFIGEGNE